MMMLFILTLLNFTIAPYTSCEFRINPSDCSANYIAKHVFKLDLEEPSCNNRKMCGFKECYFHGFKDQRETVFKKIDSAGDYTAGMLLAFPEYCLGSLPIEKEGICCRCHYHVCISLKARGPYSNWRFRFVHSGELYQIYLEGERPERRRLLKVYTFTDPGSIYHYIPCWNLSKKKWVLMKGTAAEPSKSNMSPFQNFFEYLRTTMHSCNNYPLMIEDSLQGIMFDSHDSPNLSLNGFFAEDCRLKSSGRILFDHLTDNCQGTLSRRTSDCERLPINNLKEPINPDTFRYMTFKGKTGLSSILPPDVLASGGVCGSDGLATLRSFGPFDYDTRNVVMDSKRSAESERRNPMGSPDKYENAIIDEDSDGVDFFEEWNY